MASRAFTDLAARARLDLSRIEVHYQPIVDLASHRIIGLEALARWRAADGSIVPLDRHARRRLLSAGPMSLEDVRQQLPDRRLALSAGS